jgi:ketosteroid isomerase-like protein
MGFDAKYIDEWVEIWNNYRLERVRDLFLADERVTYFSSEKEVLTKGIDNLVEHHRSLGFVEGGKETGNKLWLEDVEVEEFDDTVLVKADWLFQREGSDNVQRGPVTMVYVKLGDEYRIVHCHFSNY